MYVFMCLLGVQVMKAMCKQGYNDALHFLKKNGKKKWFHVSIMLCSVV